METFIDKSAKICNSNIGNNNKIYHNTIIESSILAGFNVIGDGSTIIKSSFGKHVHINRNSMIRETQIEDYSYAGMQFVAMHCSIGKFSSISWNVSIGGANHDYNKVTTHSFLYNSSFGMIKDEEGLYDRYTEVCEIGNDVWIGSGAQILRGVQIGDGAIIGAGTVVNKKVPPYAIVVGSPARIIRMRFEEKYIERMLQLKWWNFPSEIIRENICLFNSKINDETLFELEKLKCEYQERICNGI